jgi:hypothetical protein
MITRAQWNELNNRIQTIPLETINNESALDKLESKITLIELQLLIADCNQDRSALPFRAFLNNRWEERINNALCITLANALSAIYGIGCYQLLMPSITHIENEITGTSLNDRDLNLHHFVLSDDNSRFIEVAPCLDCSENDGILKHCSLSNGEPQRLSETEIERVTKHSHEANQYYAAIEKVIEAQNRPTVGGMLHQTIVALKLGGEHGGRGGTEFDSGAEANVAIERICRYWNNELSEAQRTAIAPLAAPQHPNVTLGDSLGRLWRPQDANYRGVRYCVEVIANQMESILESHLDLYQMDIAPLMTARTEKQIALRNAITSENYAMTFDYPLSTLFLHDLYSLNKAQFHAVNQELVDVLNATPLETRLEWINNIMINRNTMYVKDFTSITNLMDKEQRNKIIRNMPDNHLQLQTSDEFIHSLSNIDPTIKLEFVRKIDIHNVRRVITGFILNIILDGLPLDEQPDEQLNFINSLGEECLRNIKIEQPFLLAQRQWQSYVQPMREHFNTAKKFIEQGNVGKLKNLLDQGPWEEMLEHVRTFSFGSLWEKLGAKEMAAVNVFQFILEKLNNISTQEQYSRFNQNIKQFANINQQTISD